MIKYKIIEINDNEGYKKLNNYICNKYIDNSVIEKLNKYF